MANLVLLLNLASTCFMAGVIWFVQLVHYAQFPGVGIEGWSAYHAQHTKWTTVVVGPAMVIEAVTAVMLLFVRPSTVPTWIVVVGIALLGLVWASTFLQQVPAHGRLSKGFDADHCRRLVVTNWARTVFWSARAFLLAYATWLALNR
jgi:hypothetical protein